MLWNPMGVANWKWANVLLMLGAWRGNEQRVSIALNAEIEFYESHKPEWLKSHRDEFVVVKGNDVLGFFPDFHRAYIAGVAKYGIETDFLVKRVVPHDSVFVVF